VENYVEKMIFPVDKFYAVDNVEKFKTYQQTYKQYFLIKTYIE